MTLTPEGMNPEEVSLWAESVGQLWHAAKELVESISFDDNGIMIGPHWKGGNGGLISVETQIKADALRRALARFEEATNG